MQKASYTRAAAKNTEKQKAFYVLLCGFALRAAQKIFSEESEAGVRYNLSCLAESDIIFMIVYLNLVSEQAGDFYVGQGG